MRLEEHRARTDAGLGKSTVDDVRWNDHGAMERFRSNVLPGLDDDVARSLAVVLVAVVLRPGHWYVSDVLTSLRRRRLRFDAEDVALMFGPVPRLTGYELIGALKTALAAVETLEPADRDGFTERYQVALECLDTTEVEPGQRAKLRARLRALLEPSRPASQSSTVDTSPIRVGDGWSRAAIDRLDAVTEHVGQVSALLRHAAAAVTGPRPTKSWLKQAAVLSADLPEAATLVHDLLTAITESQPSPIRWAGMNFRARIGSENGEVARGLLWTALVIGADWLVPVASRIAVATAFHDRKVPNACFAVLGRRADPEAIAALIRLRRQIRDRGELKQIAAALDEAASTAGISRAELTEQTVPDGGLGPDRRRRVTVGPATAILALDEQAKVSLTWELDGQPAARVPGVVTAAHASALAALKRDAAELKKAVAGERDRLEDQLVEERDWPVDQWRRLYLDHPVVGALAHRLVWSIVEGDRSYPARPAGDGRFSLADGTIVEPGAGARIRPWHPVHATAAEVEAWRRHVMEHRLAQPFKQVYREVYRLTPAEEQTSVYSNRYAAHILRYHQVYALMKERRWASNYLGSWNDGFDGEARRDFVDHGLRAVFHHQQLVEEEHRDEVVYCTTDQVRFVRIADRARTPVPLAEVPAAVLSEGLRDVDLFVGVTSIAADPTWADRGAERHFGYWAATAFADLTASAETRRDAISRLLPRLKIRDKARIDGRFLVVEGRKHTYRIHFGSGNILMSPNDQYLCIVPARETVPASVAFVPFEGDRMLAVVLSKAMLLADDHRITDASILAQIG